MRRSIFLSIGLLVHQLFAFDDTISLHSNHQRGSKDEVIELNIGGEKITTLRSTLMAIPSSKLALMFSNNRTEQTLLIDKQGAVFFDYNPLHFTYLLNQLRTIKRMPKNFRYQLQISSPPYMNAHGNFTQMLVDLGLTPDQFLFPSEGTHINLTVHSLAGWRECYRSTYDKPFNSSVLTGACNGSRILMACRSVGNKKVLTLAGIGDREDLLHPCIPKQCKVNSRSLQRKKKLMCSTRHQCMTQAKRGVGWYHVTNQTWGFVRGSLSFAVNPCDSSQLDADYRLCWTLQSGIKQINGDRCGSARNLQQSNQWERLIYYIH